MQACPLRDGSAAPYGEPAALPSDTLTHLRGLAAAMLCSSSQRFWTAHAFIIQQNCAQHLSGMPASGTPAALMTVAKREFQDGVRT